MSFQGAVSNLKLVHPFSKTTGPSGGLKKHSLFTGLAVVLGCVSPLSCPGGTPRVLTKSFEPAEQKIPLVMYQPDSGKMTLEWINLRWDNMVSSSERNDALEFKFDQTRDDILFHSFRSQMWISALASGIAWEQPWLAAKWTVSEVPQGEASGNGAALGIALIATASRMVYPPDTVVLGRLNPDGSLGLVARLAERVEVAAASGMKRVIIPNMQRFEVNEQDEVVNIPALAEKRGLECTLVDNLIEATEVLLGRKLPQTTVMQSSPRYPARFAAILDAKVGARRIQLKAASKSWPRSGAAWNALPPPEQSLWRKVFRNYDLGIDAYQAGQLYTAHQLLKQAWADQSGLAGVKKGSEHFDLKAWELRAIAIRQAMVERLNQPLNDKNELQSALVMAEENDWIYGLNAGVQGAQIMAKQVFDARSDATPRQQEIARTFLISAVTSAEVQMADKSFYAECYPLVAVKGEVGVYNRAASLWPQLLPAQLGKAEIFILGLKSRANEVGDSLLYDARLSSFVRGLKESKAGWEQQQEEAARQAAKAARQTTVSTVGFVPGKGYLTPKMPVPPLPVSSLSDAARCLTWVNEYCEVAMLEQKYLHLGGSFDANTYEWNVMNRVALESMLQLADQGARRGIALAQSVGADSSILNMIYEMGSNLRASEDNNLRLEGLRQYWRCALLGGMCWQLSYSPSATVMVPEAEPVPLPSTPPGDSATPEPAVDPAPASPDIPPVAYQKQP